MIQRESVTKPRESLRSSLTLSLEEYQNSSPSVTIVQQRPQQIIQLILPHIFVEDSIDVKLHHDSQISAPQLIVRLFGEVLHIRDKSRLPRQWDDISAELENCVQSCFLAYPEEPDQEIPDGILLQHLDSDILLVQIRPASYLDIVAKRWMAKSIEIPTILELTGTVSPFTPQ